MLILLTGSYPSPHFLPLSLSLLELLSGGLVLYPHHLLLWCELHFLFGFNLDIKLISIPGAVDDLN